MKNETGIFEGSLWIWPESHNWDLYNGYALFRKELSLKKVPTRAPLFITADQSYQLYVNGRYVCRGPARGFQESWPYDEVDVRPFLQPGRNVLAVRAYNPGVSNFQYLAKGFAGLLVAARWGRVTVRSDKTWKCRRQSGINRGAVPTSLQLFPQEHIDLREEEPEWMMPGFEDAGWTGHVAEHPWNGMPWSSLEARGIPLLEEGAFFPGICLGEEAGRCAPGYRLTRDVARLRHEEKMAHEPKPGDAKELVIEPTGKGRFRSFLIDFGKTVVGSAGFAIEDARGGEILDTLHVETIDRATLTPDYVPDKHCRMAFAHRMVCRRGDQTHMFYHAFGFRYMVVTVRDSAARLRIKPILRGAMYPMREEGVFESAEADLERIWKTCAWTQRVCSLDAYVDTPWREQAQWWGDARVQAKNTFFLAGDDRLFRRGIAQIARQTSPEGLTYGHAPTIAHHCILPDFTLIWLVTLWDHYWQTGSTEAFCAHQATIKGALAYFRNQTDAATGLIGYDKRFWLFLDWTGIFREGYSTVYNLWLLIALEKLADLFQLTGEAAEAQNLTEWADKVRDAIAPLVREDGLLSDGFTFDHRRVEQTSIHSQTLAELAGFQPQHRKARFQKSLLPFLRGEITPEVTPSAYWITYVFEVLAAAGHGAEVVDFLRSRWLPMTEHGTTWENFSPRVADESFSHAWSAHPLYHLMEILGGIRQTQPGWKEVSFSPVFLGAHARVAVPTPLGKVYCAWARTKRTLRVSLKLPPGMTASVCLPGNKNQRVQGAQSWTLNLSSIVHL